MPLTRLDRLGWAADVAAPSGTRLVIHATLDAPFGGAVCLAWTVD
jgi:hypothetical protein